MKTMWVLVRRELWEHPSLYVTPLVIGVLFLLSLLVGLVQGVGAGAALRVVIDGARVVDGFGSTAGLGVLLGVLAPIFTLALLVVAFFYLLDTLYAERRERTILFFKSLPVTDTVTVASKALTALLVAPLLSVVVLVATQILALVLMTVAVALEGGNPLLSLWRPLPVLQGWVLAVYGALSLGVWYAPFAGWLMLVSAWARKAVLLWAVSPWLLGQLERLLTGRSLLLQAIAERATGYFRAAFDAERLGRLANPEANPASLARLDILTLADPIGFLSAPALWLGIGISGVFLAGATSLRRYRDDT